ncbi:MAG: SAM-dependent methyltransferase [Spirochaetia bacterium]|jgi:hypothetical protein
MMPSQKGSSSIADASQPNAGRIYDYLLGGNHNFEIDRIAANQLVKDVPYMNLWVRLIRWFLGEAVQRLLDEGFTKFLDFASGLPTVDHIHYIAPKGSKVIYSDIDPVTVAYAHEIIKDLPNVAYVTGDAGKPESILGLDIVGKLFGEDRKLAFGFNGIAWFLTDEQVAHALQVLYEWGAPGSRLYICDVNNAIMTPITRQLDVFYAKVGQPIYVRSETRLRGLIGKWKVSSPGFRPLEEWLPIGKLNFEEAEQASGGNLIGAILTKE